MIIGACLKRKVLRTGHIQMTLHRLMNYTNNTIPLITMPANHSRITLHCPDCIYFSRDWPNVPGTPQHDYAFLPRLRPYPMRGHWLLHCPDCVLWFAAMHTSQGRVCCSPKRKT